MVFRFLVPFKKQIKRRGKRVLSRSLLLPFHLSISPPSPNSTNLILFVGHFLFPLFQKTSWYGAEEREAESDKREKKQTEKVFLLSGLFSVHTHECLFLLSSRTSESIQQHRARFPLTPSSVRALNRSSVGVVEPFSLFYFLSLLSLSLFSLYLKNNHLFLFFPARRRLSSPSLKI